MNEHCSRSYMGVTNDLERPVAELSSILNPNLTSAAGCRLARAPELHLPEPPPRQAP